MKKLLLAVLLCFTFVGLRAQTLDPNYIDGHLYFKFVDSYDFQFVVNEDTRIEPSEMKQYSDLFNRYGVTLITRPLYAFNDPVTERIIRLEFTQYTRIAQFIRELEALPEVEYAERVPLPKLFVTYNDPLYSGTWSNYGAYQWNLSMINAEAAWAAQVASSDIKVAVVDGAVWGGHPDLGISSTNMCSYATGTAVQGSSAPPSSVSQTTSCSSNNFYNNNCPTYDWSHGTHCAGMVAAKNNNGVGISSIGGGDGSTGSGLTLMGVRAANDNDQLYYCSNGVAWAVNHGANVVSMSYGGTTSSTSERNAYQSYYNNGVVLVAAAGNDGDGDNAINYPAGYSSVISVASVDKSGKISSFSEYGTGRADIAAPGGYYNANNGFNNILSTTYCVNQWHRINGQTALQGQYYDGMQGTSMACPTVAGLCGLMLSAYPDMTPAQVKNCLQSSANSLASGSNQIDGYGYINASAAVNCAKSLASSLRANPAAVTIASGGGSKTVEITSASALSGTWTASCNNATFTISPTSGAGSGATTTMTITAAANETGAPINGTITITQGSGSNQQTATVSVTQNDQSDLCVTVGDDLFADDSLQFNVTAQYFYEQYSMRFAQRFPNTTVGSVDSVTLAGYYVSATAGSMKVSIYNDNNGVPGTELVSKTITMTQLRNAAEGSQSVTNNGTVYYGSDYGIKFNTAADVTGDYYVVFDFSSVTAVTGYYDCVVLDVANNANTQTGFNNGMIEYSSSWYPGASVFTNLTYYDIAVSAHLCASTDPYVVLTPTEITTIPLMGVEEVAINSNTDWTATASCDWVSLSPASGSESGTLTIITSENMGDERNCTITFTYEGGTATVNLTQMAHQEGCDDAVFYSDTEFGWRVNDAQTALQWDEDSIYFYAFGLDRDATKDSGYYMGVNAYGDKAKANLVPIYGTANITEVLYLFTTTGTGGSVTFKIWDGTDGTPGDVLASKTVTMSSLSGSSYYEWVLDEALDVTGSVFVGADLSSVTSGSYIGFYSNYLGGSSTNNAWEQWSDDTWNAFTSGWGYSATAAIFPAVCYNGSHLNIDLAMDIMDADTANVITSMTLNAGEALAPLYRISNIGEATYTDSTKIYITLEGEDLASGALPPLSFYSGAYIALSDTIATMSELNALGYHHNDVLNLCYRVAHTNTTYTWNDQNSTNNEACITVTINCPPQTYNVTEAACGSYTFGANTYTSSGVYRDTLAASNGCDSIVTLTLTINQATTGEETVNECGSYVWNGTSYSTSGDYQRTLTGSNGCDSTATLHLTISAGPSLSVSGNQSIYTGQSTTLTASGATSYEWKLNGTTVSTNATFTTPALTSTTNYTLEGTTDGCTSTMTVTVSVQSAPSTTGDTTATACGSFTWGRDGQEYTSSGDYDYTIIGGNAQGGDSIITLHLTIYTNPTVSVTGNTTITTGGSTTLTASATGGQAPYAYVWSQGNTTVGYAASYTASPSNNTTYNVSATDNHGCEGTTTVTVIVSSPSTVYDTTYITECGSYTWYGNTYTTSNTYTHAEGNNVHVLILTINQNPVISVSGNTTVYTGQSTTLTASGANSYSWATGGNVVSTSNPFTVTPTGTTTYTVTGTVTATGCSASTTVTVYTTQAGSTTGDVYETACDSYNWTIDGHTQTYNTSGNYTYTIAGGNALGGDSIVTLHLTINTTTYTTEAHTACDSYTWHGTTYTASNNNATFESTGSNGCPLITTLNLTINYSTTSTESATACDSYTWSTSGATYTNSGQYTYNNLGQNGCLSTSTLNLTINHSTTTTESAEDCGSYFWNVNNQSYTQSGTYSATRTNSDGCNETVTLYLTIHPNTTETDVQVACDSYTWAGTGLTYYENNNTATYTGMNQYGCDNVVTLNLTINHSVSEDIYDSVAAGETYSNYGFTVPASETRVAEVGSVIVKSHDYTTTAGCDSTIVLHLLILQGTGEGIDDANGIEFSIFPNPAMTNVEIDCENISDVKVYDITGRMIHEQKNLTGDNAQVNVSKFAEGSYVFSITTNAGVTVKQKVVVKH